MSGIEDEEIEDVNKKKGRRKCTIPKVKEIKEKINKKNKKEKVKDKKNDILIEKFVEMNKNFNESLKYMGENIVKAINDNKYEDNDNFEQENIDEIQEMEMSEDLKYWGKK